MNKHKITFLPSGKTFMAHEGMSVLEAASRAGVHIATRCGGKMGCLMCKIHVSDQEARGLSFIADAERRKLGSLIHNGTRFACQSKIQGSVTVTVPEDRLKAAIRKQLEAVKNKDEDLW